MRKLTKVVLVGGALAALLILLWIPWSRYTDLGITSSQPLVSL